MPRMGLQVASRIYCFVALCVVSEIGLLRGAVGQNPNIAMYVAAAKDKLAAKDLDAAQAAIEQALDRDALCIEANEVAARVARAGNDMDAAVWYLHRVVDIASRSKDTKAIATRVRTELFELDENAKRQEALEAEWLRALLDLAKDQEKKERFHAALALFGRARALAPFDDRSGDGVDRVRKTGGPDVAVADVYAGGDPDFGKSSVWIAENDAKHVDWKMAWTKESDNYRYRTNAGFRVLETAAIAMENVNRFYRRFFRFKEDGGKIAKIEIRIFKSRDEYLKLGRNPVEWSAGHFIGDAVETYVGGVSGNDSIRQMYGTLFHEAAHHFVSMTSPRCPGWLNEAFASFFEGCEILSNGTVRWNRVPAHRLFPLATRLERGWMSSPTEGIQPDGTGSPEKAPTIRMIVESQYRWGPPWYAPTWGLVYFLHNYRDERGKLVWREALQEFYTSFKGKQPQDMVEHFETVVLGVKGSPVRKIDEVDAIWKHWLLELREFQRGKAEHAKSLVELADLLLAAKDEDGAMEALEDAYLSQPSDPEVAWRLAKLCEKRKNTDRAAALYAEFAHELEQSSKTNDERYAEARKKVERLDPLTSRLDRLEKDITKKALELARAYREAGMPMMAMTIAQRLGSQFPSDEAAALYRELAMESGKSLVRWQYAYDESTLDGWSVETNGEYSAYGNEIRAHVPKPKDRDLGPGQFVTNALTADVAFESDYSFETEVEIVPGDVELAGICFGRKDANDFLAVLLHPKGFLDLAASHGASWEVLDHRQVPLTKGWHTLRIDVAGRMLDFWFDGKWVRAYEFPSEAVLRGAFGLVTGEGSTRYRKLRLRTRDPLDMSARIEREILMKKVTSDSSMRTGFSFAGFTPPALTSARAVRGDAIDVTDPGHVTVLVFWSRAQEKVMPTLAFVKHLASTYVPKGVRVVLVGGDRIDGGSLERLIGEAPDGLRAVVDEGGALFRAYGIKRGGFGLPRAVVIDVDTHVTYEGDLGVKSGEGWKAGTPTYLDEPLDKLVTSRRLGELVTASEELERARGELEHHSLEAAFVTLRKLASHPASMHPVIASAKRLLGEHEAAARKLVTEYEEMSRSYPVRTERMLDEMQRVFADDAELVKAAKSARAAVRRLAVWRQANTAMQALEKAIEYRTAGRQSSADKQIDKVRKSAGVREVDEALEAYERDGHEKAKK